MKKPLDEKSRDEKSRRAAMGPDDPDALLQLAKRLAREAGMLALAGRRVSVLERNTKSSTTDLVTQHDRAAEALIVERLGTERPADAIVGEEGAALDGTSGYSWFLDPIDGTTNFVYDLPAWSTSVAVAYRGETIAGAVYVPAADELFAARLGGVATLDDRPIHNSGETDLSLALVATGFSYQPSKRAAQAAVIARLITEIRDVRRSGSAAIDLCWVAAGRVDAYFEEHLNSWDAAAGELIARQAGCITSDFESGPPDPSNIVVAAPGIHAELVELIRRSRA
jgi:myo-inositol-1(or 4)-monophosphatase